MRTGPEFGHIFDHHVVVYEFPDGIKLLQPSAGSRPAPTSRFPTTSMGTKGIAMLLGPDQEPGSTGQSPWHFPLGASAINMYQSEHNELFASIRAGKPINDGEYMSQEHADGDHGPHGHLHRPGRHLGEWP